MPLRDHFRQPLSRTHPWRAFHGTWATAMAQQLNDGVLPDGYYAVPFLDRDGPMEIDVAALDSASTASRQAPMWLAPAPTMTLSVDWTTVDEVRVEVHCEDDEPRLAAAIELVSPSNKDRPKSREALAAKCVERLRRGCGVVVIDVVTIRSGDFHGDILRALDDAEAFGQQHSLLAASYRSLGRNGNGRLEAWPVALQIGACLPTLPLWLGSEFSVPLDLETSYSAACRGLRMPPE